MRLHYSKEQFYARARSAGLCVPSHNSSRFPKIVKYGDSCGSEALDLGSVCFNSCEVEDRQQYLQNREPKAEIVVQDFIAGREVVALVVEMGHEPVALTPLELVFPCDIPPHQAFLTWHHKFKSLQQGIIKPVLFEHDPLKVQVQRAAELAFKTAGMCNGGGWGRVDMRIEQDTGKIYVIEVNPIPTMFYPKGKARTDWLVERVYPGGHAAFFDMLLATKMIQLKLGADEQSAVAKIYSKFSKTYNDVARPSPLYDIIRQTLDRYDWVGSILDLGCGTGLLGEEIGKRKIDAKISGIDLCPEMLESSSIRDNYEQPVNLGLIQEFIMSAKQYDHVACFGAMHFLDETTFTAVLSRLFMIAERSITFEVDDLPPEYTEAMLQETEGLVRNVNNVKALRRFEIPSTWEKVLDERVKLYDSPHFGISVFGFIVRFERNKAF